jgi:hypothetical protein
MNDLQLACRPLLKRLGFTTMAALTLSLQMSTSPTNS